MLAGDDGLESRVGPGKVAAFHLAMVGDGLGKVSGEEGDLVS